MSKEIDPNACINTIWELAPLYAQAKGELAELEAYKHSLKAIMMKKSSEQSLGGQERESYASQEYQDHCKAIGYATEKAELLKWKIMCAQMRHETYKVEQANQRAFERAIK
jgi:hypothetical protein